MLVAADYEQALKIGYVLVNSSQKAKVLIRLIKGQVTPLSVEYNFYVVFLFISTGDC